MTVTLMVERKVIPGAQDELSDLLRELRSKAVRQPGFISGETVVDLFNPQIFMTISTWASVSVWEAWEKNPDRLQTVRRINALLSGDPVVRLWTSGPGGPPAAI